MSEAGAEDRPLDPEKLLRIASLAREVLEEVRKMDPDEHTSAELAALHQRVTTQLHQALPRELVEELEAIDLDLALHDGATPQEVRIAYSGLIGWLGGLFQGLQAAMQMQTLTQLEAAGAQRALQPPSEEEQEKQPPGRYL